MSEDPIDVTAPVYLLDHAAVYNLNPVKQIITDFIEEGIQVPKFEELTSRFRLISSLKNFSAYGLSLNRRRSQY